MSRLSVLLVAVILLASTALAQSTQEQSTAAGTATQQVNITMTPSNAQPSPAELQAVTQNLKDVHFAFDKRYKRMPIG